MQFDRNGYLRDRNLKIKGIINSYENMVYQ